MKTTDEIKKLKQQNKNLIKLLKTLNKRYYTMEYKIEDILRTETIFIADKIYEITGVSE